MKKYLYVSYISNNRDIKGILLIKYNLYKLKSSINYGCIVTENVDDKTITILENNGIIIFRRNLDIKLEISISHKNIIKNHHVFGKFFVFSLCEYDKIIYLDSDTLILNNIDHLFNIEMQDRTIYMCEDMQTSDNYEKIIITKNKYNSGVILLKPDNRLVNICFKTLINLGKKWFNDNKSFHSDQYIFEILNVDKIIHICTLNISYNLHPILVRFVQTNKLLDKIYIIHFMLKPKPWDFLDGNVKSYIFENTTCQKFFQLWLDLYNEMVRNTFLSQLPRETNIKSFHYGKYNHNNELEYINDELKSLNKM